MPFEPPRLAVAKVTPQRLGVEPANALFIDDYQGNVDGAVAAGLRAVCCGYTVESTEAALAELLALF